LAVVASYPASRTRYRRHMTLAAVMVALSLLIPMGVLAKGPPPPPVNIQFLNVSDWHGQIVPLSVSGVGSVGGAAAIGAYWAADRAANPNSLTLTGGDDVGATPPISTFFDDFPSIIAQRMMGIQVGTFGNHNFDHGISRLQEHIDLAGAPTSADAPGSPFHYVSANLRNRDDNLSGVEDFKIFDVGGVKVGVVGITNPEAPTLVFPGSFGTIVPTNPYPAANKAKAAAKKAGAQVVVAVIHAGVRGFDDVTGEPFGELIDFANNVGGFDVIFGDHTDIQFSGVINGQLVLENRSKGLTYAKTTLSVDPRNGRVSSRNVEFVTPLVSGVTPDPAIAAYVADLQAALQPILGVQIANSTKSVPRADQCGRADGRLCESLVGNIVTDAMRASFPNVDFAVTNSGGLRAALTCPAGATDPNPGDFCPSGLYPVPSGAGLWPITEGTVLDVLPFGNIVVTVDITGAELKTMLEIGVSSMPGANGRFPQVSGMCFTYNVDNAAGSRVTSVVWANADGTCSSTPVDLTSSSTYRIVENDFMASGGDGYPNFASRMTTGDLMDRAVSNWLKANTPVNPFVLAAPNGRINCTGSSCPALTASPPTP
jgi:2',3'-cyclic-nucleotide 2'-phosphodiesterase (5'-nucleotidase family)